MSLAAERLAGGGEQVLKGFDPPIGEVDRQLFGGLIETWHAQGGAVFGLEARPGVE